MAVELIFRKWLAVSEGYLKSKQIVGPRTQSGRKVYAGRVLPPGESHWVYAVKNSTEKINGACFMLSIGRQLHVYGSIQAGRPMRHIGLYTLWIALKNWRVEN